MWGKIILLFVGLSLAWSTTAMAAYKPEYKLSLVIGPQTAWGQGAMKFADLVRERTGGKINIKCYFAGQLFAGMLLDAISIYYIFLPILIPVIKHLGWDPMWFGVMMTVNLAIGTITPPVALNLYVAANLAKISMERISRSAIPFIIALIVSLMIVTYIPSLSLWLPRLFGLH